VATTLSPGQEIQNYNIPVSGSVSRGTTISGTLWAAYSLTSGTSSCAPTSTNPANVPSGCILTQVATVTLKAS
ncbi:MAG: hypothetical protein ACP5RP_01535, partial [Candidatus Micrarchaeia archaeon]